MEFTKMIVLHPGDKRSQDVVEFTEWNDLWNLIITQGNHSENAIESLNNELFGPSAWVEHVTDRLADLDEAITTVDSKFDRIARKTSAMVQPVGMDDAGQLWTFPAEMGIVQWGSLVGSINNQDDLMAELTDIRSSISTGLSGKANSTHNHAVADINFTNKSLSGACLADKSIPSSAYADESVNTDDLADESVTTAKIKDANITTTKYATSSVTRAKLAVDAKSKGVAVVLAADGWADNAQTVAVEGVTANNNVLVAAAPASREAWNDAEIYCSAQGNGTLTFVCGSVPAEAVTANVVILV